MGAGGEVACAGELEHPGLARDLPDPLDRLHGELSAIVRLHPSPKRRTWTLGRSAAGILRAVPFRRSSCLQGGQSFAARVDVLHAGSGGPGRREEWGRRRSRSVASSGVAALRNADGMVGSIHFQWKARLARFGGSASSRFDFAVVFDCHVLCQPVEHVGPMPADRFPAMSALLRKASQHRQTKQ
jgi:hypothetical protein